LNLHADEVADNDVAPLLTAIFGLADELDVEADKEGAFKIGDNRLRIHWLLRQLTLERFDLATRSKIFMSATENAALGWLIDFTQSAYRDYHPGAGKQPEPEEKCLTTEADALALRQRSLAAIRISAKSGEIAKSRLLAYLLFMWRELADDAGAEVHAWTAGHMADDAMITIFAKAFTTFSWSQSVGMFGLGDAVAKRNTRANVEQLDKILDLPAFRSRVEEVAANDMPDDDRAVVREFLSAWRTQERNPFDF
jgi:hypothetical protein